MILLDTSVLVRYLRTASPAIREVLRSTDCGICGVTRAEILHGARTAADADKLRKALDELTQLPIDPTIWDRVGQRLALRRDKGLPMPFQDVVIAVVAIDFDIEIWSFDAHYRMMQAVFPDLKIFEGPST